MPQHVGVRIDRQALLMRPMFDAALHHARPDALSARAEKQRAARSTFMGTPHFQPTPERFHGVLADRHDAGLAAFAGDAYFRGRKIDAADVETGNFGDAQSR